MPGNVKDKEDAPRSISEYIETQPDTVRPVLEKIRETIRAAAPDAVERIAWSMPTFWQGENLLHFAAMKKHIGIYPGDVNALTPFTDKLKEYETTKGSIHFPLDKPVDYEFITELVKFRVASASAEKAAKAAAKSSAGKAPKPIPDKNNE